MHSVPLRFNEKDAEVVIASWRSNLGGLGPAPPLITNPGTRRGRHMQYHSVAHKGKGMQSKHLVRRIGRHTFYYRTRV